MLTFELVNVSIELFRLKSALTGRTLGHRLIHKDTLDITQILCYI